MRATGRIWLAMLALVCTAMLLSVQAAAQEARWYVVQNGDTLGAIARRHDVSVAALCEQNNLRRTDVIRVGQRLRIPASKPATEPSRAGPPATPSNHSSSQPQVLHVPGAGTIYYYEPTGPGRQAMRPVLLYLHGRGANPQSDCRRWAPVARALGWLVCPAGPEDRGDGARGWANSWPSGRTVALASIEALRSRYGRRVQRYGNTIIGFSEGAFVAMNVGVREARTFNRWLILAASDSYWGQPGEQALMAHRSSIRKVYLITGQLDGVHDATLRVRALLRRAGVQTRISTPAQMGHAVPLDRKAGMYRAALGWLHH